MEDLVSDDIGRVSDGSAARQKVDRDAAFAIAGAGAAGNVAEALAITFLARRQAIDQQNRDVVHPKRADAPKSFHRAAKAALIIGQCSGRKRPAYVEVMYQTNVAHPLFGHHRLTQSLLTGKSRSREAAVEL